MQTVQQGDVRQRNTHNLTGQWLKATQRGHKYSEFKWQNMRALSNACQVWKDTRIPLNAQEAVKHQYSFKGCAWVF